MDEPLDALVDLTPETCAAAIEALYRRSHQQRVNALALREPEQAALSEATEEERREMFLNEVGALIVAKGGSWAERYLQRAYRLPARVARAVMADARRALADRTEANTRELRAIAGERLEDMMRRAQMACDLASEAKIIKEWLRLHGLYQQPEGGVSDIAALIRKISAADGAGNGKVVDAEFEAVEGPEKTQAGWTPPDYWAPKTEEQLRALGAGDSA